MPRDVKPETEHRNQILSDLRRMANTMFTWRAVIPAVVAAGVVACGDSTGPEAEFDPAAAATIVSDLLAAAEQNGAVRSLTVLGSKIQLPAVPGAPLISGSPEAGSIPILDPGLGRRLVYNADNEAYEFAADAGDTPPNVVRFVLYNVDTADQRVIVPLEPTSDLDLADESTAGSDVIGVRAAAGAEQLIDYDATASGSIVITTLVHTVSGFVASDGGRIDMDLEQRISQAEGVELDYQLARGQAAMRVELDFDAQTFTATTTLTVNTGGTVLSMTTSGTPQSIEGNVRSDNAEVVRIGGTSTTPVFTDTDNNPITGPTLSALGSLFASPDRLFDIIDATLAPAYWAFGLSIIFQN